MDAMTAMWRRFDEFQPNRVADAVGPAAGPRSGRLLCSRCERLRWRSRKGDDLERALSTMGLGWEYTCEHRGAGEPARMPLTPGCCPFAVERHNEESDDEADEG